jgi:hypothetical protein
MVFAPTHPLPRVHLAAFCCGRHRQLVLPNTALTLTLPSLTLSATQVNAKRKGGESFELPS